MRDNEYGMTINFSTVIDGDDVEVGLKYDDTEGGHIDTHKKGSLDSADDLFHRVEREVMRQFRASTLVNANNAAKELSPQEKRIQELEAEVASLKSKLDAPAEEVKTVAKKPVEKKSKADSLDIESEMKQLEALTRRLERFFTL